MFSMPESLLAITMSLHLLSVVVWVGGMFFAHMAMRPVVIRLLEPPVRIPLLLQVLTRFFNWVWLANLLLWSTGTWLILFYGGLAHLQLYIYLMLGLGTVMTLLFLYLFFIPYSNLKQAVSQNQLPQAGQYLNQIRFIINVNLTLGLIIIVIAVAGRYI